MAPSTRTVRDCEPRVQMKLHRNHFETDETALSGVVRHSSAIRGGSPWRHGKPLMSSLWAAERSRRYRFGLVNAIFNERKVLSGDDIPDEMTDETNDVERE